MRLRALWLALVLLALAAPSARAAAPCTEIPDPARWSDPGAPDAGAAAITIAAHRGAAELAPENTLDAYRYAIAYGVEMIEVDVQQTLDGRFVSFHDTDVAAKTNGTGRIGLKTYAQARALNVADNPKWKGTEYDPAHMPALEEVMTLANRTGVGIYFDMKESLTNVPGFMALVSRWPEVVERSAFLPYEPARALVIRGVAPFADIMFSNLHESIPPSVLFALGGFYRWFGSDLETYDAGKVAAIHDACSLVIPNVYDGADGEAEARNLHAARAMGADGAQVNLPDVTADALDQPVATRMIAGTGRACLVATDHALGLPRKPIVVAGQTRTTDRHGCVPRTAGEPAAFAGDGSALGSALADTVG